MKTFEGQLVAGNEKFCIVLSRFNDFIGAKLLSGAIDELRRHGVDENNIDVVRVPGAFEIPIAALKFAKTGKYNAVITLGAVIKALLLTMIMFVQKFLKVLRKSVFKQKFL